MAMDMASLRTAFIMALLAFQSASAAKTLVGGDSGWRLGFNYTDWVLQNAPFHVDDTLVFQSQISKLADALAVHDVWLFKRKKNFQTCDFGNATMLGVVTAASGFQIKLQQRKTYCFGCSVGNGYHCSAGLMKFCVKVVQSKE